MHAFVSLIYPFSWQHTFIPLLPPNLIDIVCAPTPYIVGLLSSNAPLLNALDEELDEVSGLLSMLLRRWYCMYIDIDLVLVVIYTGTAHTLPATII